MDFISMAQEGSSVLVMILFVLTMMLRSSKHIPNWAIQWIVLGIALVLSYLELGEITIDTIMNAFLATGICIFGENAIYRKDNEKTSDEKEILDMASIYIVNEEESNDPVNKPKKKKSCDIKLTEEEKKEIQEIFIQCKKIKKEKMCNECRENDNMK